MAGYSARQSTFTTGDTITAAHSNNEFNSILAAFHVSTGHKHDGSTAGDGGPISTLFSNAISMGTNANTDIAVTFNGATNDGVLTWMEDEDYFKFSDEVLIDGTEKLLFRDTAIYINSSTDGQLDIVADTEIQIAATTIDMNGNVDISGSLTLGGTTITSTGAELNILDGVTSTAAELNILDGVTSTAAELNILDGVTSTTAELNILDGVTSTAAELNILDGVTSTTAELNILDGVTSTAAELNLLDGSTAGTVVASKAVVVDSDKDLTGIRNLTIAGDLTISGDDLTMATNTAGNLLIADGTNYNPTAVTDLSEISSVASGDVLLAVDASGGGLKKITRSTLVSGLATSSGIANIAEDTTPQLGGNLDSQGNSITDVGILGSSYGPTGTPTVVTVTVASKTAAHPYYGDGSSSGYFLDGAESPAIDLHGADSVTSSSGYYYKFDQADSSNSGHPLRFYLDAAKTIAYTTGVTTSGTPGTAGAHTTIAVTDQTPSTLYYQCSSHAYMGNYAGLNSAYIASSSAVTIDAVGDITLDADGGDIVFKDAGTTFGSATNTSGNLILKSGTTTALTFAGANATAAGNLAITGNLTVNGTTTTVNSTTVTIDDPIFTLGGDSAPGSDDNKDRGIEFRWHNGSGAKLGFFGYDDSASAFTFIPDATNSSEVFSGTAGNVVFGNIAGTLTTASQTNVTGVGALDAGSITSNFGTINTGSSNITTTGAISGGTLAGTLNANQLSGTVANARLDADLQALAGLTSAADKGIQFTGSGTAGVYDLTSAGKALLDDADAAAQRTTLGLGTAATTASTDYATSTQGTKADNAAAKASNLSDLASASTARTNLGLGTAATLAAGTSATNAVQLDSNAKLPAVDGSQLTGIASSPTVTKTVKSGKSLADGDPVVINSAGTVEVPVSSRTASVKSAVNVSTGGSHDFSNQVRHGYVKGGRAGTAGGNVLFRGGYNSETVSSQQSYYAHAPSVNASNVITVHTKTLLTGTDGIYGSDEDDVADAIYDPDTDRFILFYIGGTQGSTQNTTHYNTLNYVMMTQASTSPYGMTVHTKQSMMSDVNATWQNPPKDLSAAYDTVNNRVWLSFKLTNSNDTSTYPSNYHYAICGTVTGGTTNTISWGNVLRVDSAASDELNHTSHSYRGSVTADPDQGGVAFTWVQAQSTSGGTERVRARVLTVNTGTNAITKGTRHDVSTTNGYYAFGNQCIYDENTDRFVWLWKKRTNDTTTTNASGQGGTAYYASLLIRHSTNATFTSSTAFVSNYGNAINDGEAVSDGETNVGSTASSASYGNIFKKTDRPSIAMDTSTNKCVVVYGDAKDGDDNIEGKQYAELGTIVGGTTNTITFDYANRVTVHDTQDNDTSSNAYFSMSSIGRYAKKSIIYDAASDATLIVYVEQDTTNNHFKTQALVTARDTTLTSGGFIGYSDGAYSSGTTATIQLSGSIDDAQSSLTTGSPYYLQESDMSLSTTPSPYFAGTALSSTSLLIKGQTNKANVTEKVFCGAVDFRRDSGVSEGVLISLPDGYARADVRGYHMYGIGVGFSTAATLRVRPFHNGSTIMTGNAVYGASFTAYSGVGTNNAQNNFSDYLEFKMAGNNLYVGSQQPIQTYDGSDYATRLGFDIHWENNYKNLGYRYQASMRHGSTSNYLMTDMGAGGGANSFTNQDYISQFYIEPSSGTFVEGIISVYAIIKG